MLSCFSENENKVELNDSNMVSNDAKKADVDDAENVSSDSNSKETKGKFDRLQFDWKKFSYLYVFNQSEYITEDRYIIRTQETLEGKTKVKQLEFQGP